MLVLVDSGILIRLYEASDPLHGVVQQAITNLIARGDVPVTAHPNFAEFWNVCTRPATARGGLGLSIPVAEGRLSSAERRFGRLAEVPTVYPHWRQLLITHGVQGKQVHDARLVALMLAHGITHILTLNGADFTRYPGVTVLDPARVNSAPPTP